mmetsp:Transcript_31101/g.68163  ORF Transcript_31101/g.68163 Transcript_31101/m.68163 type:complete len:98 (+) Transcript_31101:66-359(+)
MKAALVALLALALASLLPAAQARAGDGMHLRQPETATGMAGLEGEACSPAEHERYKTIVCKVEEACGCAETKCQLDWCSSYVHEWKKDFGACVMKGC